MFNDSARWILFMAMMVITLSSMLAFVSSQYYVKSRTPDLWENFFPGRSIGFAHDLKFPKFAKWLSTDIDEENTRRLPLFWFFWWYYKVASGVGGVLIALNFLDFGVTVYQSGMIGGWKFR